MRTLSQIITDIRTSGPLPECTDLVEAAGIAAMRAYGPEVLRRAPPILNTAILAVSFGRQFEMHVVTDAAHATIESTELRCTPPTAPSLFKRPFLIERRGSKPLFGSFVSIGAYSIGESQFIVALSITEDQCLTMEWRPRWEDRPSLDGVSFADSPLIDPSLKGRFGMTGVQILKYAVTLGALLDAETSPLERESVKRTPKASKKHPHTMPWVERHVSLSGRATEAASRPMRTIDEPTPRDTTGLHIETVTVSGHIKMQAYGPAMTLRKMIYVSPFASRRWVADIRRVIVTG